jgi:hypothetical protein
VDAVSKPKRYRRLGMKRTPGPTYAVSTHEVKDIEVLPGSRSASDRALGVIGIALAVAAVVGLVLAVALT